MRLALQDGMPREATSLERYLRAFVRSYADTLFAARKGTIAIRFEPTPIRQSSLVNRQVPRVYDARRR
jgi:hypothetical protein